VDYFIIEPKAIGKVENVANFIGVMAVYIYITGNIEFVFHDPLPLNLVDLLVDPVLII
jgi:hypothetical protein